MKCDTALAKRKGELKDVQIYGAVTIPPVPEVLTQDPEHRASLARTAASGMSTGFLAMAQQNQEAVFRQTQEAVRTGTQSQRQLAHHQRIGAIEQNIVAHRLAASREATQATVDFAVSIINLGNALADSMFRSNLEALLTAWRRELQQARRNHVASLQGGYYIRPFFRDGWRLAVVEVKSGRSFDLLLSPDIEPLRVIEAGADLAVEDWNGWTASHYIGYPVPITKGEVWRDIAVRVMQEPRKERTAHGSEGERP